MGEFIFRVETRYGTRDYNTLKEAKKHSDASDHIQLVDTDGLTVLSRVARKRATPSWVKSVLAKYGITVEQNVVISY